MGIIQDLGYQVPRPNAAQRATWVVSSSRPGSWLFARSLHHVDKALLSASRGRLTSAGLLAGIPVLTVTTTGARSGARRTVPLLGVPYGDDIAVIGTRFGQPGTPGWYYNLRANPAAEVIYREKSVRAVAREAEDDERAAIWDRARSIYAGYEAYARRITGRKIRIMVLSAAHD
jgi:deazaflavin-dependent oxidoreductase (nitroreductase family)